MDAPIVQSNVISIHWNSYDFMDVGEAQFASHGECDEFRSRKVQNVLLPPIDRLGDNLDVVSCNLQTRSSPAQDPLDLFSFWFSLCVQAMVPNDIDRSPRCSRHQPPKHADMGCRINLLKLHR